MMKQSRSLQILASFFAAGLVLSFTFIATAQSGRRASKSPQTTVPPVAPTTAPAAAKPSPEKLAPVATLLVGIDKSDGFSLISLSATSGVLHSCVDRLNDSASVKVIMESPSMTRGDAVKKAKAGTEGQHVVWLQVGLDRVSASQGARVDPHDVFIEFIVFAPTTAKIIASGRTYPQTHRQSGIPSTRTGGIYGDYLYNKAAREAAERILRAFHVTTRPLPGSYAMQN
jgi:hypothetical protein